eukprot:TRINITY_DN14498_c0_g1_i1.p1 TRINITY_DN14498_c0_g1~~TRINITY_DN14498_c0_g1_i1.p1  ORF type:complete len:233 (-),score=40.46 TRINITY_DN14498_c0_g1_i1:78-701(-)
MDTPQNGVVSIDQIGEVLQLPLLDAARHLGVCVASVKKICRRNGIARWPQRKIFSVERMIKQMEATRRIPPSEFAVLRLGIQELAALRRGPFGGVALVPKLDEVLAFAEVQQLLREMSYRDANSLITKSKLDCEVPLRARHPSYPSSFAPFSSGPLQQLSLRQQLSAPLRDDELQYLKGRLSQFSEYYNRHGGATVVETSSAESRFA